MAKITPRVEPLTVKQICEPPHCLKYKICVSGSASTGVCSVDAVQKAEEIGRLIVENNGVCVTGATTGIPYWAAKGAKDAGGISIGISPAASEVAHIKAYRLPVDYFDLIIYTGFDYSGRNLLLIRSSDAVIIICGRIGTLNEFTIAFEDNKPIGVLLGTGGTVEMLPKILETAKRGQGKVVFDTDPKKLMEKVLALVRQEKVVVMPPIKKKNPLQGGKRG
ncbi:MAG: hypothetical protein Q7S89_00595 [bacterium]|nr:hypothetical protein [bacterium]